MDKQEIFTQVKKHLLKQNKQSLTSQSETGKCLYYGKEGMKCAIGALLPKWIYSKDMENKGANALITSNPEVGLLLGVEENTDIFFLDQLQEVHDAHLPKFWSEELKAFAEHWNLKY